ncbi:MAG: fibronectin type III domain-containing protein [Nitrospirota bacterium]|nr:fibronectin type III domain-containing protein [Nitrospirota bacterium]
MRLTSPLRLFFLCVAASLAVLGAELRDAQAEAVCVVGAISTPLNAAALEGTVCAGNLFIRQAAGDPPDPDNAALTVAGIIRNGGSVSAVGNLTIEPGAVLKVTAVTQMAVLDAGGNFLLDTSARIDLDGQAALSQPAGTGGVGNNSISASCGGSGGGHGGVGGGASKGGAILLPGGLAYEESLGPQLPGSSGGMGRNAFNVNKMAGGKGGGSILIQVGGISTLNGLITANGTGGQTWGPGIFSVFQSDGGGGGGGSGGTVRLITAGLQAPAGVHLSAQGGAGGSGYGGSGYGCSAGAGGGGGRIAVYYRDPTLVDATALSCPGGPRGNAGLPSDPKYVENGAAGSCHVTLRSVAPTFTAITPAVRGQGSPAVPITVTGADFRTAAVPEIDGARPGLTKNGITITSVTVTPPNRLDAFVSIGAGAIPGPKPVRVINADGSASTPVSAFSVSPGPVITQVRVNGVAGAPAPRGFNYTLTLAGQNFQVGAGVAFGDLAVSATGPATVDTALGTLSVPIFISASATAGNVAVDVTNPDGGVAQTPGILVVQSLPVISSISPASLFAGQTSVPVTVLGTGFIPGATVIPGGTGVTLTSRYDSFTQMTAWVSVPVEGEVNLTETCTSTPAPGTPCRDLWINNNDVAGAVSTPVPLNIMPVPPGTNSADMLLLDGSVQPLSRRWNGFGWSSPAGVGGVLPQTAAALVFARLPSGDLMVGLRDTGDTLSFRRRSAGVWADTPPVTLPAGASQPFDVAAVSAAGSGAGFFAAFGGADGKLYFRTAFNGTPDGVFPPGIAQCDNALSPVAWVRLAANRAGNRVLLAFARQDRTLCAAEWNATGASGVFSGPRLLADPLTGPGLSTVAARAFDVTYWGAGQRGMVAWGKAGSVVPDSAVWDSTGGTWTVIPALFAAGSPTAVLRTVRLAAAGTSERVVLVNSTEGGELFAQFWSGTIWGLFAQELPQPLVTAPDVLPTVAGVVPFDIVWSSLEERLAVVYGLDGQYGPQARWWTPLTGWGLPSALVPPVLSPLPASMPRPLRITAVADPTTTMLLVAAVDWNGDPARPTTLSTYVWDGLVWSEGRTSANGTPVARQGQSIQFGAGVPQPLQVTGTAYKGVQPAAVRANSTGQVIQVTGSGFINPPRVVVSDAAVTVTGTRYRTPSLLDVTLDIGAASQPGSKGVQVINPGGATAALGSGLTVLPRPVITRVLTTPGVGDPACVPVAPAGCGVQTAGAVQVQVEGSGFAPGAVVVFSNPGIHAAAAPVFSSAGGVDRLSLTVGVDSNAAPGLSDVTVVNTDSSTGVGNGLMNVLPYIVVTAVSPATVSTGAVSQLLVVDGANFQGGVQFAFGVGIAVQSVTLSATNRALVTVDVAAAAAPGARPVTATNADGGTTTVTTPGFFGVISGPTITAITPTTVAQGGVVTAQVAGSGFTLLNPATAVTLSGTGIGVSGVTVLGDTALQMTLTVAPDAPFDTARSLTLTDTNGGRGVLASAITVRPVPRISGIVPVSATLGESGKLFTLSGSGFMSGASVQVRGGGVLVSQQVVSQTQINLTLDVTALADISIAVLNPDGQLTSPPLLVPVAAPGACDAIGSGTRVDLSSTGSPLACSSITVDTGAVLALLGDIQVVVSGDVLVRGGGILLVDSANSFARLKVGGNLTVQAGGLISANSYGQSGGHKGAPGTGFGGGVQSGRLDLLAASGATGGGYGGRGADGSRTGLGGSANDLNGKCVSPDCIGGAPLMAGSGGGSGLAYVALNGSGERWWRFGGSGGGAMVLDVGLGLVNDGTISSNGGAGSVAAESSTTSSVLATVPGGNGAGGGSGGSVLIRAGSVGGTGVIAARGGAGSSNTGSGGYQGSGGGGGRVAVYYRSGLPFAGTLDCSGGPGGTSGVTDPLYIGSAGTCLHQPQRDIASITPALLYPGDAGNFTLTGGLAAGDFLQVLGTGVSGGLLASATGGFSAPFTVAADAALGARDLVALGGDVAVPRESRGSAILFGGVSVHPQVTLLSLSPAKVVVGQTVTGTAGGTNFEAGAVLHFLQGGVEPMCLGVPCVSATVDGAASSVNQLVISSLSVAASAPLGLYDLQLVQGRGIALLRGGLAVLSADGSVPVVTDLTPAVIGEGVSGRPAVLWGYDFVSPVGASQVTGIATSLGANAVITAVPGGCLSVPAQCQTTASGLQQVAVTVTTAVLGGTAPTAADVTVTGATGASTVRGGLTVNPRPALTSSAPAGGTATFTLTVQGTQIVPGAVISLDDASGDGLPAVVGAGSVTTGVGTASITASVTVPSLKASTLVGVRVTNPDGGTGVLPAALNLNPAPTLTSISPTSVARGETAWITLTGSGFHPQSAVAVSNALYGSNGFLVNQVQRTDVNTLLAQVSVASTANITAMDIVVTNPNGGTVILRSSLSVVLPRVLKLSNVTVGSTGQAAVGAGAETAAVTLTGTEFGSSLSLGNIHFSNPGIHRLTSKTGSVYDESQSYPSAETTLAVRSASIGGITISTVTVPVRVDAGAAPGTGTVTLSRSGAYASHAFTVNPRPVVATVAPSVLVRGATGARLAVGGFNFVDTPRVCAGSGCSVASGGSDVRVTKVSLNSSGLELTVTVDPLASLGWHPLTVENPDGGRFTLSSAVRVLAGFAVTGIVDTTTLTPAPEIAAGATAARTITGSNFVTTPANPAVAFLRADGSGNMVVDTAITASVSGATAGAINLSLSVTAGAPLGYRTVRVTNGDGAKIEIADFLLVTGSGPTIGKLQLPSSATRVADALGLLPTARTVSGVVLAGVGFNPASFSMQFVDAATGSPWPGISLTAPVVAVDGRSATFDLTLAPSTPIGRVAVKVTSGAATDTRAALLKVNAAPTITGLNPATLAPGASRQTVRIDGALFQPGADVAVVSDGTGSVGGITVFDLDPGIAGVQAGWVSGTSMQTVLSVAATAQGGYILSVTNPDGGQSPARISLVAQSQGTRGKVAYLAENSTQGLKVRDWLGAAPVAEPVLSGGPSSAIPHTTTRNDLWNVVRSNPMQPGQYLMAVGAAGTLAVPSASGVRLYRSVAGSTNWTLADVLGSTSSTLTQAFDLAFEQGGNGDALLVYGATDNRLYYKFINGATGAVTGPFVVQPAGQPLATTSSPVRWVRLIPQSGTRRMLLVYSTEARQIHAAVWDGASGAFVTQFGPGVLVPSNGGQYFAGVLKPSFDGAWQALSGNAVVVWGQGSSGSLYATTWNGVTWSGTSSVSAVSSSGGPVFIEAEADRTSDRVAVFAQLESSGQHALVSAFWNGAWSAPGLRASASSYVSGTSVAAGRNFDLAWDGRGRLVTVYSDSSRILSRTWTAAGGWSAEVQELPQLVPSRAILGTSELGVQTVPAAMQIVADPWSDEMLMTIVDGASPSSIYYSIQMATAMYRWDGRGWAGQSVIADSGSVTRWAERADTFAANGVSRHFGGAVDVAYEADLVAPAGMLLTETGRTATGVRVGWNAPGDDGNTGRAGGYDLRWSNRQIVDGSGAVDCAALLADPAATQVCFADAEQVLPLPVPATSGSAESALIDFTRTLVGEAPGTWYVALRAGDRPNTVDAASGAQTLHGNLSPMATLAVILSNDAVAPEAVTNLAVVAGPDPRTTVRLTWTGVGNDAGVTPGGAVLGYDLRIATLPISEVGGNNNFAIPFDKVQRSEFVAPVVVAGETRGTATTWLVTGLAPGITYHFAVKGIDANPGHYAPISNVVSFTTALAPLAPVTDLSVNQIGSGSATLVWTVPAGGAESYDMRLATLPITDAASFALATPVQGVPLPTLAGSRQTFTVYGLATGTTYHVALVPVRWDWVNGVRERRPVELFRVTDAVVSFTTTVDAVPGSSGPDGVGDLQLVTGSVRTHEARLFWTAPQSAGGRAARYEFRWALQPNALAPPVSVSRVWVPLLPADPGTRQEFTLTGLPANAGVYVVLLAYDAAGRVSVTSNEVVFQSALRNGLNAISVPGQLSPADLQSNLLPIVGSCVSGGVAASGSGAVGACGPGQTKGVSAWGWDPTRGVDANGDGLPDGDFVPLTATLANFVPGGGVFVAASGSSSVLNLAGADLGSYPPIPLSGTGLTLISSPFTKPAPVSSLVVRGPAGANWSFAQAVAAGIVDGSLLFLDDSAGAVLFQPVGSADMLLPRRSYFIRLTVPVPGSGYSVEVPRP